MTTLILIVAASYLGAFIPYYARQDRERKEGP